MKSADSRFFYKHQLCTHHQPEIWPIFLGENLCSDPFSLILFVYMCSTFDKKHLKLWKLDQNQLESKHHPVLDLKLLVLIKKSVYKNMQAMHCKHFNV